MSKATELLELVKPNPEEPTSNLEKRNRMQRDAQEKGKKEKSKVGENSDKE